MTIKENLNKNNIIDKTVSLRDIFHFLTFIGFIIAFIYAMYEINQEIKELTANINALQENIKLKEMEINNLRSKVMSIDSKSGTVVTTKSLGDVISIEQYLPYIIGTAVFGVSIYYGSQILVFKNTLPPVLYNMIKSLPFLQKVETYTLMDPKLNVNWFAEIINESTLRLFVESTVNDDGRLSATDYVLKIMAGDDTKPSAEVIAQKALVLATDVANPVSQTLGQIL